MGGSGEANSFEVIQGGGEGHFECEGDRVRESLKIIFDFGIA